MSLVGPDEDDPRGKPPVPDDVQEAVRTLIRWAGDDPDREGLLDTPKRVARAWKEYCLGYTEDPAEMFQIVPPGRGLFRPGSLLARARNRVNRKRRAR